MVRKNNKNKRPSAKKALDKAVQILSEQDSSNKNNNKTKSLTFEQFDASTSTWPILGLEPEPPSTFNLSWPMLGLEPDATPVLPRRQLSPKVTKKKEKKKTKQSMILPTIPVVDQSSLEPCIC